MALKPQNVTPGDISISEIHRWRPRRSESFPVQGGDPREQYHLSYHVDREPGVILHAQRWAKFI